jgi:4-amino-4-deoxy-L-arabinose transferase-like glycosyltransferase
MSPASVRERLDAGWGSAGLVVAIVAVALAIRLIAVLATPDYPVVTDSADYDRHATSIATGHGYPESLATPAGGPTAFRPPLYPYLLAGVYSVAGAPAVQAARVVGALIGGRTVVLIGVLGQMLAGRRAGLVAMAIAAVYPPLWISDMALISEPLFVALELGALIAVIRAPHADRGLRWIAVAGVLAGLAILTRANGVVLLIPLLVAALSSWSAPAPRRAIRATALIAAVAVAVTPWTVRNTIEFDAFVGISTQTGYGLAGTYNEEARVDDRFTGAWRVPSGVPAFADLFAPGSDRDEAGVDAALRARAVEFAADHPGYVAEAGLWNTARLLGLTGLGWGRAVQQDLGIGPRLADLATFSFWLTGALALAGAFTAAARRLPAAFWAALALLLLSAVLISGSSRYRTPIEPFVIVLAALAVEAGRRRLAGARSRLA